MLQTSVKNMNRCSSILSCQTFVFKRLVLRWRAIKICKLLKCCNYVDKRVKMSTLMTGDKEIIQRGFEQLFRNQHYVCKIGIYKQSLG